MDEHGLDAMVITPGADLRYLTGYDALPLERLTALVIAAGADPLAIVPALERPALEASSLGRLGVDVVAWDETDDPWRHLFDRIGSAARIGVDDHMWAARALALQSRSSGAQVVAASHLVDRLRIVKEPAEIEALAAAGAAIDRVHARVPEWLAVGRTEREVGRDIATAIIEEGHERVDFVIVGSGPNSANPHAELSDRVVAPGDLVVVDIGGTNRDGYCSDSTRTYVMGAVPDEFVDAYDVLQRAQNTACAAIKPGVTAESVDAAAREPIAGAGYGDAFIHRTGHGIGMDTHEQPYIVEGNELILEEGMTFSVEPGIYFPSGMGARIEDIVVVTESGVRRLNQSPRDLVVLAG